MLYRLGAHLLTAVADYIPVPRSLCKPDVSWVMKINGVVLNRPQAALKPDTEKACLLAHRDGLRHSRKYPPNFLQMGPRVQLSFLLQCGQALLCLIYGPRDHPGRLLFAFRHFSSNIVETLAMSPTKKNPFLISISIPVETSPYTGVGTHLCCLGL